MDTGKWQIDERHVDQRLDQFLSAQCTDHSRTQIQAWIKEGHALIDGNPITKPNTRLVLDQTVAFNPPKLQPKENWAPQAIAFDTLFEDEHLLVVNKPAGLTMHPGSGQPDQTLANGLAHHDASMMELPRCGIVHRLDQWTSGVCVVAKTIACYHKLIKQMQNRDIERHYRAWVHGDIALPGTIETHMGRHLQKRTQQAVRADGKLAITHFKVAKRYGAATELTLKLETGRTHQIRVHMLHIKHAIIGDPVYHQLPKRGGYPTESLFNHIRTFPRQALHAYRLQLVHPITGEQYAWIAPLPQDLTELATALDPLAMDDAPYDTF